MSDYTPTQRATALDRIAATRAGFTGLGAGYRFGVTKRPDDDTLTSEERAAQTEWGILEWDTDKLGDQPTDAEIEAEAEKGPPIPLADRLREVTAGFDPGLKSAFPFERVAYWIDQGDADTARAVIEAVDVSGYPQDVQDAKAVLIAQFEE